VSVVKVDSCLSRKMTVLSIIAMLAVVFIHSTAYFTLANPARWNIFAETLVTRSFTRWAVPFFFVVSGFWFGRGAYISEKTGCGELLKKKWKTLLVPYLCWCVMGFLVSLPLIVGNNLLCGKGLWERTIFAIPGLWAKFDAFFGVTNVGPQSNMPLWYVRCLLVMFLFAPIWKLVLKIPHGAIGLLVFALANVWFYPIPVPYVSVPTFAFVWFAIGLSLAQFPVERWRVLRGWMLVSLVLYALGSVAIAALVSGYVSVSQEMKSVVLDRLETALVPSSGILFFWGLYDRIPNLATIPLPWCFRQTFFIYCLHEIICSYWMSSLKYALGKTDMVTFCISCIVPWLSIGVCVLAAVGVHRWRPRFYGMITGERG